MALTRDLLNAALNTVRGKQLPTKASLASLLGEFSAKPKLAPGMNPNFVAPKKQQNGPFAPKDPTVYRGPMVNNPVAPRPTPGVFGQLLPQAAGSLDSFNEKIRPYTTIPLNDTAKNFLNTPVGPKTQQFAQDLGVLKGKAEGLASDFTEPYTDTYGMPGWRKPFAWANNARKFAMNGIDAGTIGAAGSLMPGSVSPDQQMPNLSGFAGEVVDKGLSLSQFDLMGYGGAKAVKPKFSLLPEGAPLLPQAAPPKIPFMDRMERKLAGEPVAPSKFERVAQPVPGGEGPMTLGGGKIQDGTEASTFYKKTLDDAYPGYKTGVYQRDTGDFSPFLQKTDQPGMSTPLHDTPPPMSRFGKIMDSVAGRDVTGRPRSMGGYIDPTGKGPEPTGFLPEKVPPKNEVTPQNAVSGSVEKTGWVLEGRNWIPRNMSKNEANWGPGHKEYVAALEAHNDALMNGASPETVEALSLEISKQEAKIHDASVKEWENRTAPKVREAVDAEFTEPSPVKGPEEMGFLPARPEPVVPPKAETQGAVPRSIDRTGGTPPPPVEPPKPPATHPVPDSPVPPQKRQHQGATQILDDPDVPGDMKKLIADDDRRLYDVQTNKATIEEADEIMTFGDPRKALDDPNINPAVKTNLATRVANEDFANGDTAQGLDTLFKQLTKEKEAGQLLQAKATQDILESPATAARMAAGMVKKVRGKDHLEGAMKGVEENVQKIITMDTSVRKLAATDAIDEVVFGKLPKGEDPLKRIVAGSAKGGVTGGVVGGTYGATKDLEEGESRFESIMKNAGIGAGVGLGVGAGLGGKTPGKMSASGAIDPELLNPFALLKGGTKAEKELAKAMKMNGTKVADLAKMSLQDVNDTKQTLADAFVKNDLLTPAQAADISERMFTKLDARIALRKKKILADIITPRKRGKITTADQRVMDLVNAGQVDPTALREALAAKAGLPAVTEEFANSLSTLVKAANGLEGEAAIIARGKVMRLMGTLDRASLGQKISSFRILQMLTGVPTILRNIVGGTATIWTKAVEDTPAAMMDLVRSALTGSKRQKAFPSWKGLAQGAGQGLHKSIRNVRENIHTNVIDEIIGGTGLREGGVPSGQELYTGKQSRTFGLGTKSDNPLVRGVSKGLQAQERVIDAALNVPDAAVGGGVAKAELDELAKVADLNGETFTVTPEVIKEIEKRTLNMTFKNDTAIGYGLGKVKQGLNAGHRFGAGSLAAEFTRAAGALATWPIERSPLGFATTFFHLYKDIGMKNQFAVKHFEENIMKAMTGTFLLFEAGKKGYQAGVVSAGPSDDTDQAKFDREAGRPENSINLSAVGRGIRDAVTPGDQPNTGGYRPGDTSLPLGWAQPLTTPALYGANYERRREQRKDEGALGNAAEFAKDNIGTVGDVLEGQSLIQFISGLTRSEGFTDAAGKMLEGSLSSFLPQVSRNVTAGVDPTARVTGGSSVADTAINRLLSGVPGASETLPVKYDGFGRPAQRVPGAATSILKSALFPARGQKWNPPEEELYVRDLYKKTKDTGVFPPAIARKYDITVRKDGQLVKEEKILTEQETSDMQKMVGEANRKLLEKDAAELKHRHILSNPTLPWSMLPAVDKAAFLTRQYTANLNAAKAQILKEEGETILEQDSGYKTLQKIRNPIK